MSAGIGARRAKLALCIVQQRFQFGSAHACLHRDGLIGFIEGDYAVHVCAYVHGDAAERGFHSARDRGAPPKTVTGMRCSSA